MPTMYDRFNKNRQSGASNKSIYKYIYYEIIIYKRRMRSNCECVHAARVFVDLCVQRSHDESGVHYKCSLCLRLIKIFNSTVLGLPTAICVIVRMCALVVYARHPWQQSPTKCLCLFESMHIICAFIKKKNTNK